MDIQLAHTINEDLPHRLYWGRLTVRVEPDKKATIIVGASRDYIADIYAQVDPVARHHVDTWVNDTIEYLKGLPPEIFLLDTFRFAKGNTYVEESRVMDFLKTIVS